MQGVKAAAILMGVLIILGVAVIGVTIVRRLSAPAPGVFAVTLDEAAGTRIGSISSAGDRLAVLLQGGGGDRVVVLDPHTGMVAGRVVLAH